VARGSGGEKLADTGLEKEGIAKMGESNRTQWGHVLDKTIPPIRNQIRKVALRKVT